MRPIVILLVFASPVMAQDRFAILEQQNAELMKRWQSPPIAPPVYQYPTWEEIRPQALHQRRSGVIFVNVAPRKIQGLMCSCNSTFTGMKRGIIVAGLTDTWFDRYDLPATATDDDILFVVHNRRLPVKFMPKQWQPVNQYQPANQPMRMYQQPMVQPMRIAPRRAGGC